MDSRNNSFNHNSNRNRKRPIHFSNGSNKKPRYSFQKPPIVKDDLPILEVKYSLLEEIEKHPSLVLIGETGCGKTTQLPQYLHEFDKDQVIGITQPRRIAAISVALRVANEMGTNIGDTVGYKVRFEDTTSSKTKIKYLTDGMLLRESMQDPLLSNYNVIILDEAHERTLNTDILFGIVKLAQEKRKERGAKSLKIIIMSATLDPDTFTQYFNSCPCVLLEGREYPVSIYHSQLSFEEDYLHASLITIFQIHKEAPPNHDILVFLTGQEEVETAIQQIKNLSINNSGEIRIIPYPLYGSMNQNSQMNVFRKTPVGSRKVILSTNIAETSVTIPGIKYVIDSGMVKVKSRVPGIGLDLLKVERISKAQALQRTGRAGRESPGTCYRLFSENEYYKMPTNPIPEIKRCCLSGVVLQLLSLRINPKTFDFIDKPSDQAVLDALRELKYFGAIESLENLNLTEIGKKMSQFPIEPRFSKMILMAKDLQCLNAIISIVAILSGENIFVNPKAKKHQALEKRKKFISSLGDHITMYNVWKSYINETNTSSNINDWCYTNFLNRKNLEHAYKVQDQLKDICKKKNIYYQSFSEDSESIRKCLLHGMPFNVAYLQKNKQYISVLTKRNVYIHPSSVLFNSLPELILFNDLEETSRTYIKQLSVIEPEWFDEVNPKYNGMITDHKNCSKRIRNSY